MTMSPRRFKVLLTWSWVVIVVGAVVEVATESTLPEPLRRFQDARYGGEWGAMDGFILGLCIPILAVVVASYVGLYRLRRWGRSLWLWTGVVGCVLSPLGGPSVATGWSYPFFHLSAVLYGVILALSYVPPVAQWLDAEPRPAPAGGPAEIPSVSGGA